MTTIDTRPDATEAAPSDSSSAVVAFLVGAADWVTSTDHKKIGRLYIGAGMVALLAASALGLLLGLERADDGGTMFDADALLQMFQAYRVGLVFAVVMPLGLGLSIAVAPMQLGARSIAFPRLALTGFYSWLGGLALTMSALGRNGGIGGGDLQAIDLFLAGHGLMIVGLVASAGCVATSVLTTRAPGMTMRRVPLFAWSALIGALGMLLVLPVAFGAIIYLFLDHRYGQFNFGDSEGIAAWLGWIFSVPAVAVFALPAVGVAAEMIPIAFKSRQVLRGFTFGGIALVGVTALGAVTQQFVHDLTFDTDAETFVRDVIPFAIFMLLPLKGIAMVMGLGAFTAKKGMSNGRPRISAPLVFGIFGLALIKLGLLTSALIAITDLELLGTTAEEGATLFIVYGTALGVMGGVVLWAPKLWGRSLPDKQVLPLALLAKVGAALAAFPLVIAGFLDLPGGMPGNDAQVGALLATGSVDGGALWVTLSLIGHALIVLTVLAFAGLKLKHFVGSAEPAEQNPYDAHTVEWGLPSPAPAHNFDHVATVASPTPQFDMTYEGSQS